MGTASSSRNTQARGTIENVDIEKKTSISNTDQQQVNRQLNNSSIYCEIQNTEERLIHTTKSGACENTMKSDESTQLQPKPTDQEPEQRREATYNETAVSVHKYSKTTSSTSDDVNNSHTAVVTVLTKDLDICSGLVCKLMSLEQVNKYRHCISKLLIDTQMLDMMCQVVIDTYVKGLNEEDNVSESLKLALSTIGNFCDDSDELSIATANIPGFAETVKRIILENTGVHLQEKTTYEYINDLLEYSLTVVHNMLMRDTNVARFRSLQFTDVLKPFLHSPKEHFRLISLACLSGIIDEKESAIINANKDVALNLMEYLRRGLASELRRNDIDWSCTECGLIVRKLAKNDANKKLLVEVGALELLVELGNTGNHEEQYESVRAIWELSFDEANRNVIVDNGELGAVELLAELQRSENSRIREMCDGALWTLRKELQSSKKYTTIEKRDVESKPTHDNCHVMISYNWADQNMILQIRDKLKDAGHTVWVDVDQMAAVGGSTLEAMAKAVERASVVLICMSQKYKNSPNCRTEAEYAFMTGKKIIPLKMEMGYRPDGWLGMMCGAKMYYEFSGKYSFDVKMKELLREVAPFVEQEPLGKIIINPPVETKALHSPAITDDGTIDSTDINHPSVLTTSDATTELDELDDR